MVPRCHGGRSGEGARDPPLVPGRTQPSSKRPIDLPRSAATCEGGGGTVPPHCPPAHARAASGTRVRLLSPGTHSACSRGPPALMPAWHALLLALAARLRWPSCWCAQRTPCWPGVAARTVASAPAASATPATRTTGRCCSGPPTRQSQAPPAGAQRLAKPSWGTGGERNQPHGQSAAAPVPSAWPLGGQRGEARRSSGSSVLPSLQGAGTSPGSPAIRGGSAAATRHQPLH
jgi:hypothetical protein